MKAGFILQLFAYLDDLQKRLEADIDFTKSQIEYYRGRNNDKQVELYEKELADLIEKKRELISNIQSLKDVEL